MASNEYFVRMHNYIDFQKSLFQGFIGMVMPCSKLANADDARMMTPRLVTIQHFIV